jgi:hypothetical protein
MIGLFAMAAAAAAGTPPTVFGLEFGKPLSIPVCRHQVLPGGTVSITYESEPAVTCYEPDIQLRDAPWRRGSIDFPIGKAPMFMSGNLLDTLVIDGKLEGLRIQTLNHNNTTAIARELAAKFGKPTSIEHDRADVEGIAVPSLIFTWRLSGLTVTYTNIDDDMDYGEVLIETPAMQRLRRARDDSASKARTAL